MATTQITEFELFKNGEYFRGHIRHEFHSGKWVITCLAAAGGTVCTGFMDFKHKLKGKLIERIKAYGKRHKMKFKKIKSE